MIKIGNLILENRYVQAPLAGYSDRAYRHLAVQHGSSLSVTEMISTEGLWRKGKNSLELLNLADNERKVCVQLFGSNPESYKKSLDVLFSHLQPSAVDINAGCPVRKVIKTGSGSAMMKDLQLTAEIVRTVRAELPSEIPLGVKFRLGFDEKHKNYIEFADTVLHSGADFISMHTRTAKALYSGKASDDDFVKLRKAFPSATIFASGDIFGFERADFMIDSCNADGVLIARGGIGNPFIFEHRNATDEERIEEMKNHFKLLVHYEGKKVAVCRIRKFIPFYLKGIENASRIRADFESELS